MTSLVMKTFLPNETTFSYIERNRTPQKERNLIFHVGLQKLEANIERHTILIHLIKFPYFRELDTNNCVPKLQTSLVYEDFQYSGTGLFV